MAGNARLSTRQPGGGLVVREATPADQPALHTLNNAAAQHVNALTPDQFAWLATTTKLR